MQIVAVTVDPPDKLLKVKNKIDAEFNFISDPDLKLMDQFGLRHENGNPIGGDIARPADSVSVEGGHAAVVVLSGKLSHPPAT